MTENEKTYSPPQNKRLFSQPVSPTHGGLFRVDKTNETSKKGSSDVMSYKISKKRKQHLGSLHTHRQMKPDAGIFNTISHEGGAHLKGKLAASMHTLQPAETVEVVTGY
mmetsp:Transcript_37135/g.56995  ORF Transcript_37135/g.56995 Transcript_37135/m.56995 type:complete len:109 (+) Transcript_37135:58-384(+)